MCYNGCVPREIDMNSDSAMNIANRLQNVIEVEFSSSSSFKSNNTQYNTQGQLQLPLLVAYVEKPLTAESPSGGFFVENENLRNRKTLRNDK